ncbi:hypothetical protein MJO28_013615 [Puccinia striiformis f. sp. tritici]|uniref:Uncharacterized protein n=2 Tax=Puccinia striiformis TaxID=27350 RepID=A0A2S4WCF4_9BASI|nr:hypothetical protein Pst134EA_025864 [Puccinia striiformis f. sp. tritici]KAH9451926.1 hypothetical protein Pst134EA_025864 [Puccinia striiformis f. sp. tritici]KAI7939963.1 hypothetical protein MJO28_013615 [Puccinia striiformis f. sp. tritici]POW19429.1 hypothetical protein PSHT_04728 [Puccinia striiformis]
MNNTEANKALSSKEQNAQDLYGEPKFLKKKRKKEMSEGIENLTWNPSTGLLSTKDIILRIVPEPIPNLDKNCQSKINGRHLALHRTNQSQSRENKILGTKRKLPTKRQVRFLELERLITSEQKRYRYEDFVPLHQLWLGYMSELLELRLKTLDEKKTILTVPTEGPLCRSEKFAGMPSISAIQAKLLKADYHGAHLIVTQAKNPSLVDLQGIVIQESEQTFKVIQANNEVKTIPKAHTIFQISLPLLPPPSTTATQREKSTKGTKSEKDSGSSSSEVGDSRLLVFKIFGNQFVFRPTDRVNKKFKSKAFSQL